MAASTATEAATTSEAPQDAPTTRPLLTVAFLNVESLAGISRRIWLAGWLKRTKVDVLGIIDHRLRPRQIANFAQRIEPAWRVLIPPAAELKPNIWSRGTGFLVRKNIPALPGATAALVPLPSTPGVAPHDVTVLRLESDTNAYHIICVYAPNDAASQKRLAEGATLAIESLAIPPDDALILGGDLNAYALPHLESRRRAGAPPPFGHWKTLLADLNLFDEHRRRRPRDRIYTRWHRKTNRFDQNAARLDHVFLSADLCVAAERVGILRTAGAAPRPDHDAVYARLHTDAVLEPRKSRFRLLDSVLRLPDFQREVRKLTAAALQRQPARNTADWQRWLDDLFAEYRELARRSRPHADSARREARDTNAGLWRDAEQALQDAEPNTTEEDYVIADMGYLTVQEAALDAADAALSSRKHLERSLAHAHTVPPDLARHIKYSSADNRMRSLQPYPPSEGTPAATTEEDMAAYACAYYTELLTAQRLSGPVDVTPEAAEAFPEVVAKLRAAYLLTPEDPLSHEEAELLSRCTDTAPPHLRPPMRAPYTVGEVETCLKDMNKSTAPGEDGITVKFYITFWDILGPIVTESYNCARALGTLSERQRTGLIQLLYKKGDRDKIQNWRPITLLQIDRRLFGAVLAKRIAPACQHTISSVQTGFMQDRCGSDNVWQMQAVIRHADRQGMHVVILNTDFEKAYDRVEHLYALRVLAVQGFPLEFLADVRAVTKGARSKLMINGTIFPIIIPVTRSALQGDPFACMFFNTQQEPTTRDILADPEITGVPAPREPRIESKLVQYADDAAHSLKIDHRSPDPGRPVKKTIAKYRKAGKYNGSSLNLGKTEGMLAGAAAPVKRPGQPTVLPEWTQSIPIRWVKTTSTLGIPLGPHGDFDARPYWAKRVDGMRSRRARWNLRGMRVHQRVYIATAIIASVNMYAAAFLPAAAAAAAAAPAPIAAPAPAPGQAPAPGPAPANITLANYQATQKLLTELTAAIGGPAAVEAYLAGRRAAAADNVAA
eukprot:tig00020927_g15934.t1